MFVMARWHGVQMLVPAAASHPLHFLADNTAWAAWRGERGAVSLLGMEPRDYPHSTSSPAITPAHLATKVARVVFSSPRSVPRWELQPMTRLQTYKSSSWTKTLHTNSCQLGKMHKSWPHFARITRCLSWKEFLVVHSLWSFPPALQPSHDQEHWIMNEADELCW